jgi:tetratricopeptide (TPR) repeat protein
MRSSIRKAMATVIAAQLAAPIPVLAAAGKSESDSRRIERVEGQTAAPLVGGGRWALVVGVDQYQSKSVTPLKGAVADAKAIAGALVKYADFPAAQVFTLTTDAKDKPTSSAILDKLAQIRTGVKPDDVFIFFFAGHGVETPTGRFLLTSNADISSAGAMMTSSLPVSVLMQQIETLPVTHRLVWVDACRDNPLSGAANVTTESFATAFVISGAKEGGTRATLLSSSLGESAYEWTEKGRGFFSYYIEEGLKGGAAQLGRVTVTSLADYLNEMVPRKVKELRGKSQTPYPKIDGPGLTLVRAETVAANTASTPTPPPQKRTIFGFVKDSDGRTLEGVKVAVALGGGAARGVTSKSDKPQELVLTTDENGFFTVEIPADAVGEIRAQLPGYGADSVAAKPGDVKAVKLFLPRTTTAAAAPAVTAAPSPTVGSKRVAEATAAPSPTKTATAAPTKAAAATAAPTKATAAPRVLVADVKTPTAAPTSAPTLAPPPPGIEMAKVAQQKFLAEDFSEAERTAREAIKLEKDNPLATAVLANCLAVEGINRKNSGKVTEAVDIANRALKADAKLALAHNALGLVLFGQGKLADAQKEFAAATTLDGSLSVAHGNLGQVLYVQKQYRDAERAFRAAIKANPEGAVAYNGLAQVLLELKKPGDAARAAREAIARYELKDDYLGSFYVNLASALYQDGKLDPAREAVARAKTLGIAENPAYDVIEKGPAKDAKKRG